MIGLRGFLILGALAFSLLKAKNPAWYEDLMLRGYAKDRLPPQTLTPEMQQKFDLASKASAAVGLPVGWILEIATKVSPQDLPLIAKRIAAAVKSMGAPLDTSDAGLAAYKAKALAAGGAA
jgi:hypothetical protein